MTLGFSTPLRNALMDTITVQAGGNALLDIYDGVRPATGAAITTQNKIAELVCNAVFAPASANGQLTLNSIPTVNALVSGTAAWFRLSKADGTFVMDGSVATTGGDINLNALVVIQGATMTVTSGQLFAPNP